MNDNPEADDEAKESAEDASQTRQRSKVAFPYTDLGAALAVANAIQENVGNGDCSLQQLSAWMDQSIKSSGFRVQIAAARLFGVIESDGTEAYRLTLLGRRIVDSQSARKAKADAFLNVPLFKLLYESHKEGVLPPAAALEREIASLGVAEKQKDRARQVFDRSAEQAGFYEHGKNRLVMPAVAVKDDVGKTDDEGDNAKGKKGGNGGGGGYHPFIEGLLQYLPEPNSEWTMQQRVQWLQTAVNVFAMLYSDKAGGEIKISLAENKRGDA